MSTMFASGMSRPTTHARDYSEFDRGSGNVNVGSIERMVSAVGGGALAVYGLSRGTVPGLILTAVGGALLDRGMIFPDWSLSFPGTRLSIK